VPRFDLSGRRALVTGAGQGVGTGIARALADHGATVRVNDLHPDRAEAVAASIPHAVAVPFDVTDPDAVTAGIDAVAPVDILVNNAGVPEGMGIAKFAEMDPAEWGRFVDLNLYGVLHCCRAVIGPMTERGWGRIITISSGAGVTGINLGVSVYGAGKGGALAFMRHLAVENARTGVTANSIALGLMERPDMDREITDRLARSIPVGRMGTPDDVGACVVYVASEEASWLTAQTINLDGGSLPS
jgi:NAD(P)-dependent dehydrogenase (short-subunit alcohol dehydrogenase family)